jgi:hypothetical protein
MAGPEEKYLDDIGEEPAAAPAAETSAASEKPTEPTTQADAQPTGEGDDKPKRTDPAHRPERPDGYVPKEALQEERRQRMLYEDRFNKIVERFFKEKEPARKEQEDDPPDEATDPIGALAWTKRELQRLRDAQRTGEQQTAQQQEAQRQWQEAYGQVNAYFVQKVAEKPELQTLYDGLRISYAKEYSAFGMSPAQVAAAVDQQEAKIIQWAYANRYPIDAVIEQLAASRGVQAKAPEKKPAGQEQNRDPETGQFIAADPEKAARQRESQERNASLSSAPGTPVKKMTAKELAQMSEEDMWRYFENVGRKPGSKEFDRDMGFR